MAEAIETLFIELRGSVGKLQQDMGSAVGVLSDANKKITGISNKISTAIKVGFAGVGLVAVNKLKNAMFDLAEKGEQAGSIVESFEKLGGLSSSISEAQKATLGMVSSFDLMRTANTALLAGLPNVNKNFASIADIGARLADTLGIDTKQAIDELTNALISGKTKALEKFGFDLEGITGKANIQAAALSQLSEVQARLGPIADSVANANQALGVTWDEITTQIGIQINSSPVFTEALRNIGETVKKIDFSTLVSALLLFTDLVIKGIGLVVDFGKFLGTTLAQGVILAQEKFNQFNLFLQTFWQNFLIGVEGIKQAWNDFAAKFNLGVETLRAGIDRTTGFFKGMYDAVVGNSYIPDMVDEIGQEFERMNLDMSITSENATYSVAQNFLNLSSSVSSTLGKIVSDVAGALGANGDVANILGQLTSNLIGRTGLSIGSGAGGGASGGGIGGLIGTTGGAIAGNAIGAAAGTAAVGAITGGVASSAAVGAIGAAVGSVVPVVGTVIGAAVGGWIGNKLGFAKGGIVQGPTSVGLGGVMGESGPEAIMPLTSVGGRLGVRAVGAGGPKIVYQIDARGAAAGVEHQIMRALRDVEDRAVARAVNLVADSKRRGGVFGDAV